MTPKKKKFVIPFRISVAKPGRPQTSKHGLRGYTRAGNRREERAAGEKMK